MDILIYKNLLSKKYLYKYIQMGYSSDPVRDNEIVYGNGRYKGETVNGIRSGKGTMYYKNGNRFEGIYENDSRKTGTLYYKIGDKYVGQFHDNKLEGEGTYYFKNGDIYYYFFKR